MAKQSLAVKYRPKTFDDVCEQKAIVDILVNQLNTNTFQHAYLFCGPAGCGKTTAARIFANDINKGKGSPIEIDAASNSGVDNIRVIIQESKKKSLESDYKVYIVDECHSLSNGAWQALLKLLEEPPKFTIFILCTTDPQKIPQTILSRVQRYNFSKISLNTIVRRLEFIIKCENCEGCNYTYTLESLQYIAKLADGGMRNAITSLDKCLSNSSDLNMETVAQCLGIVDYDIYFRFLGFLFENNKGEAIKCIEQVYDDGKDIKLFIKNLLNFLIDIGKYQLTNSFQYLQIPSTDAYKKEMSKYIDCVEDIRQLIINFNELNNLLKWETNPKYLVEASVMLL